ncbi:MAG: acyl-CoA synthetase [Betaproteobacteria bacterium]
MKKLPYKTYEDAKKKFNWSDRWLLFDGNSNQLNLTHECIDRHIDSGLENTIAARVMQPNGNCTEMSFSQLHSLTNQYARVMQSQGVKFGDRIAVRLDASLDFIAVMFATFRLGAIFVPCSTLLGSEALFARINDAKPIMTITSSADDISELNESGNKLTLENLIEMSKSVTDNRLECESTSAKDPAIYAYSSGTTGIPKRTVLQHQAFTYLTVIVGVFVLGLEQDDRYMTCYTPGYLAGFGWGILVPMSLGTAAGIIAGKFEPKKFLKAIQDQKFTALHCPPTAYKKLLQAHSGDKLKILKLGYTAEAMDLALAEQIEEVFGSYARGHYGATEIGMVAVDYAFPDYQTRPGAMGKPLFCSDVAVLDDEGIRLNAGIQGRIALFKSNKALFSGDFGLWDDDGYLVYRGRANDVIITSGFTIGASEIEECLRNHPDVQQAAVIAFEDLERGHVPKAFVQLRKSESHGTEQLQIELKDHVRKKLGKYAYPKFIVFVNEFELNEAGKIRKTLLS